MDQLPVDAECPQFAMIFYSAYQVCAYMHQKIKLFSCLCEPQLRSSQPIVRNFLPERPLTVDAHTERSGNR